MFMTYVDVANGSPIVDMPAAAQNLYNLEQRSTIFTSLGSVTKFRMYCITSVAGAAGAFLYPEFSGAGFNFTEVGGSVSIALGENIGSTINLPAAQQVDCFVRIRTSGGNAAADPDIKFVGIQYYA